MKVLDNVDLNLDDPLNPIMRVKIPIYVVREEEYTPDVRFETPDKYLFETIEKSFNLSTNWSGITFDILSVDNESFKQEISHRYRIKKKCIKTQEHKHRFEYNKKRYCYIGSIFMVMGDKYYYHWKSKYRNMLIDQALN